MNRRYEVPYYSNNVGRRNSQKIKIKGKSGKQLFIFIPISPLFC